MVIDSDIVRRLCMKHHVSYMEAQKSGQVLEFTVGRIQYHAGKWHGVSNREIAAEIQHEKFGYNPFGSLV